MKKMIYFNPHSALALTQNEQNEKNEQNYSF